MQKFIKEIVLFKIKYLVWLIPVILIITGISFFHNLYQIEKVVDGDTLILSSGERIRLWGIDAPEINQNFGKESRDFLIKNIGKLIRIEKKGKDKYNRTLAIIYNLKGECVNYEMIKKGYVWVYYCNNLEWKFLQEKAKNKRIGLFKNNYVEPWKYRKGER